MISEETRAKRLKHHEEIKRNYQAQLECTENELNREHIKRCIAEVDRNIEATKLPEPRIVLPSGRETQKPKIKETSKIEHHKKRTKKARVGNPF